MTTSYEIGEAFAQKLDSQDPLARFRDRFYIPKGTIYMDGNSLGLLCKDSESPVLRVLEEWRALGIRGWLEAKQPWFYFNVSQKKRIEGAYP
jgi:kynureninase